MKKTLLILVALAAIAFTSPVFAQAVAPVAAPAGATSAAPQPDGSVIYLYPAIHYVEQYVPVVLEAVLGALSSLFLTVATMYIKKRWGIDVDQQTQAKVAAALDMFRKAAVTQSGAFIAQSDPGWQNATITTSHPWIANAANQVIARTPDAAALIGMTPEKLATMIAGEIGHEQANILKPAPVAIAVPQVAAPQLGGARPA